MSQQPPAGRVRVLVVDDDAAFSTAILTSLSEDGRIDVVGTAADGAEALELSDRWRPDVMLLDLNMPRVDGYEVMRRLKGRAHEPAVVVLTGVEEDGVDRAAELAPDALLRKTTDADTVVISTVLTVGLSKKPLGV